MTFTENAKNASSLSPAQVRELFTTELCNGFAVSPAPAGGLVAHVHWQGQEPVCSWADVQQAHERSGAYPCFFDGAYEHLVGSAGAPPTALVELLFGEMLDHFFDDEQVAS